MENGKLRKPRLLITIGLVLYVIGALFFLFETVLAFKATPDIPASYTVGIAGLICYGIMIYYCIDWLTSLKKGDFVLQRLVKELHTVMIWMSILFLAYFVIIGIIQFVLLMCARSSIKQLTD